MVEQANKERNRDSIIYKYDEATCVRTIDNSYNYVFLSRKNKLWWWNYRSYDLFSLSWMLTCSIGSLSHVEKKKERVREREIWGVELRWGINVLSFWCSVVSQQLGSEGKKNNSSPTNTRPSLYYPLNLFPLCIQGINIFSHRIPIYISSLIN